MRLRKILRTAIVVFLLLWSLSEYLFAFEWPLKGVILTATFGESRGDHFHNGIDLGGGEQKVFPIADGKVVFEYSSGFYSSVPIGLGNFVVLQHEGDIRSVYCHLKDGSINPAKKFVKRNESIGIVGDSGHSWGKHLHLSIIDLETNAFLNPLSLLPPIKDDQPPIIKGVYLKFGNKLKKIENRITTKDGAITMVAEVYDLREDVSFIWKLAPYSIILYRNGVEKHSLVFDSISKHNEKLTLGDGKSGFYSVYVGDWKYNLGSIKLLTGENHFSIVARDFKGNEATRDIFVFLQK